ncbi:glycoside hydrolase family 78 protein [Olivibacter sp. SDN3]|nr:glycoside hydrolase family 78 protein [Olivibacter sp. SDN3]
MLSIQPLALAAQKLSVTDLKINYKVNPIGLDDTNPRFAWKLQSSLKEVMQTGYEIRVGTDSKKMSDKALSWHSGKIESDQSIHIPYAGNALESAKRYYWQVRVWDNKGNVSPWSEINFWEMGLLKPDDWQAKWIRSSQHMPVESGPVPLFRKTFRVDDKVIKARLYITSYGLYEAYINGQRVGDAYFTPGWTSFHKQLQYQVYDLSDQLHQGDNALGVMLGDGWYRGNLMGGRNYYGQDPTLLAQLEVEYANGHKEVIISDDSWKSTSEGPIRMADIYNGEIYDARLELDDWTNGTFDDTQWENTVVIDSLSYDHLVISPAPPVRIHERLKPVEIITTPKGEKVIDFGQNLVGWVNFKVQGNAGDSVVITHAEVLDKEGNFYTENLRAAQQKITYITGGNGEATYHPHFSFQGFRYVKIEGAEEGVDLENIEAMVLHSAMANTGTFETSDSLLNQLQHNIQWGQKGNFLDVPTDCPQRDERLGWTGDAQAFFNTAAYNMDVAGFFVKWLKDLKADQFADGSVPHVIPYYWDGEQGGSAGWADAATIIPWDFYQAYGDPGILEDQYESMTKWVQFMTANSTDNLWNKGWHFGDWLFYIPNDDRDGKAAITDKYLIAQAFYANSVQLMINAAKVLDKQEDVLKYEGLLAKIKDAFVHEFVTPSGRLVSSSQTAYVLALHFDMLPEDVRAQAAERLVENIENYDNHLTTGFLGTPYLCHVLSRFGYEDVAYTLLKQETYPSWLYPVKQGATTIWERWDGIKPDGSFQNKDMNSFNHYAYGAIGDWMYKNITGIRGMKEMPAYKIFTIAPRPGGGIKHANASLETVYGTITSAWKIEGDQFLMEVTVPPNTRAHLVFPDALPGTVKEKSGQNIEGTEHEVGSGKYQFIFNIKS